MKNKFYLSSVIMAFVICISHLYAQTNCPAPTSLASSNITANSAMVSWSPISVNVYYNVHYRVSGSTNWTTVTVQTNSANLSSLLPQTTYEWQVQTACPGNNGAVILSSWSASAFFTTSGSTNTCAVPTGLTTTNTTSTSVVLHWNSTGATSYKIRYRPTGTTTWILRSSTTNSKTLNGLTPATAYQWQVRSRCVNSAGTVTFSNWSVISNFQTPGSNTCPTPTGLTSSTSGTNGVLLAWNSTGASSYNIRYHSANTTTWTTTTSSTNSKTITGLAGMTTYEWQVQSVCSANGTISLSPWSASAFFTTNSPVAISPNPANDIIIIMHESASIEPVSLTIRDFLGISLSSEIKTAAEGINQYEINVSTLKNGIYYLELSGKEGRQTVKFYVQH